MSRFQFSLRQLLLVMFGAAFGFASLATVVRCFGPSAYGAIMLLVVLLAVLTSVLFAFVALAVVSAGILVMAERLYPGSNPTARFIVVMFALFLLLSLYVLLPLSAEITLRYF